MVIESLIESPKIPRIQKGTASTGKIASWLLQAELHGEDFNAGLMVLQPSEALGRGVQASGDTTGVDESMVS